MTFDHELDATGLLCPLPVLKLAKAIREAQIGEIVKLIATDKAARIDVPHYCQENGQHLLKMIQESDHAIYLVQKQK